MNSRTRLSALAVMAAGALAACTDHNVVAPVSYAPAAYGVNGQCYYDDDPLEAVALIAAGLCPSGWLPTPMPLA